MKIFLLEDDFSLNESIKELLEAENFIVDSFYDGEIALDNLISNYLVYILDVNTPNIDGLSLLEHIKNINPNSKVLIISANINIDKIKDAYEKGCEDYIKKLTSKGMNDYITKPIDSKLFYDKIISLLKPND